MSIDTRSPETAYASKSNSEYPGSAAQQVAAQAAAASRVTDKDTPFDPTGSTASGATVTTTTRIKPTADLIPAQPVITAPEDQATIADTTPTVEGTAPAGSTVDLYVDDVLTEEDVTVTAGAWSVTLDALAEPATYVLTATATIDGYTSAASWPIEFTVEVP